ncbi:hypothetical protein ACHMW7_15975 [Aminobacter sp. UC22_36]|uniref:hypothetical protein n=1 Tax=Aminobacter sp. UC22_36 TaxID=3374549 RepID=UPI00375846A0
MSAEIAEARAVIAVMNAEIKRLRSVAGASRVDLIDKLEAAEIALDAKDKRIAELEDRQVAAREFVVRHPSLTIIDLAEFDAYLRVTDALSRLLNKEDRNG